MSAQPLEDMTFPESGELICGMISHALSQLIPGSKVVILLSDPDYLPRKTTKKFAYSCSRAEAIQWLRNIADDIEFGDLPTETVTLPNPSSPRE
jgi:hypothetical protein